MAGVYLSSGEMTVLLLAALYALAYAKHEKFIGWKSYYVLSSTTEDVKNLLSLGAKFDLDFLNTPYVKREAVVLVPPKHQTQFIENLKKMGIKYRTHTKNVKTALDRDDKIIQDWTKTIARSGSSTMNYHNYKQTDVIYAYMADIAARYPKIATLVKGGNSFEGRPLNYMKISSTNFEDKKKPVIFIDAAIHAREWISPPTVTWAIKKLTEDLTEPDLLHDYDWILMPVANPDGYEFSFKEERLWRKTRSTNTHKMSSTCPGVDGNRNFKYFWGEGIDDPCSPIFAGNCAFSEIETRIMRDTLHEHLTRVALYLTMHSYGSLILYPWSHDDTVLSKNIDNLRMVGDTMADAVNNLSLPDFPRYIAGQTLTMLNYTVSGSSKDYFHSIGVPLTFTFELPGLGDLWEGFVLEPKYIEQVCRETWADISAGVRKAGKLMRDGF